MTVLGSMMVAQNATNEGKNILVGQPLNSIGILSVPTFQGASVVFSISGIDIVEDHKLELNLKFGENERNIFSNTLKKNPNLKFPDDAIPSISGVINISRMQIDNYGVHELVMKYDEVTLCSISIEFVKVQPAN